jgi:hypothetical protein
MDVSGAVKHGIEFCSLHGVPIPPRDPPPPTHPHLLEAVLEENHEEAQNELACAVSEAPQRAQHGGVQVAAPDGEGGQGSEVVCTRERVEAASSQPRPRALHCCLQVCRSGYGRRIDVLGWGVCVYVGG